ncbi:MAG: hypothetical protein M1835_001195 [Candelina submexicana]|nr:MAG: hypothetical protein M1835_001195 [Candelina submexicana]
MFEPLVLLFLLPSLIDTAPLDTRAQVLRQDSTEQPTDLVQGNVTQLPTGSTFVSNYFNCSGLVSSPDPSWYMGPTKVVTSTKVENARQSCYEAANVVCGNFSVDGESHMGQWTNSTFGDCWVGIFYPPKAIGHPPSKQRCLEQIFGPMIDTCVNQTGTLPSAPAGNLAATAPDGSLVYRHYDEASINIKGGDQDISQGWVYDANWPAYLVMSVNESRKYFPSADTATAPPVPSLSYSDNRFASLCNIWDPNAACNKQLTAAQPPMPATTQGSPQVSYNYGSGSTSTSRKRIGRGRETRAKRQEVTAETDPSDDSTEATTQDPSDPYLFDLNDPPAYNLTNPAYRPPPGGSSSGTSSGANYGVGSSGSVSKGWGDLTSPSSATGSFSSLGILTTLAKRYSRLTARSQYRNPRSVTLKERNSTANDTTDAVTAAAIAAQQQRQNSGTHSPIPWNYDGLMNPGQPGSNKPTNPGLSSSTNYGGSGHSTGTNSAEGSSGEKSKRQNISPFNPSAESLFKPADIVSPGQARPISPINLSSELYNPAAQAYRPAPATPAVDYVPGTLSSSTGGSSGGSAGSGGNNGEGASTGKNRRQNISPFSSSASSLFTPADPSKQGPGSVTPISPISLSSTLYNPNAQVYRPAPGTPATENVPGTLSDNSGAASSGSISGSSSGSGGSSTGGNTGHKIREYSETSVTGRRVAKTFEA